MIEIYASIKIKQNEEDQAEDKADFIYDLLDGEIEGVESLSVSAYEGSNLVYERIR